MDIWYVNYYSEIVIRFLSTDNVIISSAFIYDQNNITCRSLSMPSARAVAIL